jgi:hypothetical protein
MDGTTVDNAWQRLEPAIAFIAVFLFFLFLSFLQPTSQTAHQHGNLDPMCNCMPTLNCSLESHSALCASSIGGLTCCW